MNEFFLYNFAFAGKKWYKSVIVAVLQFFPFLKIEITLVCFKISGKVPEDKLIRSDIGLDKYFLKSLRILSGTLPGPAVLYVFNVYA